MKKIILAFCALVLGAQLAFSSEKSNISFHLNGTDWSQVSLLADSSESGSDSGFFADWDTRKHPLVGIGGMIVFNLGLASWNRYMIGSAWAKTGWEEWNYFWERELTWDRDWYWTNYFLHPYQGSMYYMSARGANLNQLESMGVTILGSSIWEYLCECNAPSKNDMVYTTVGSFCVGEMFFRLSQETNEMSRLLGVAFNPERLFTEYICRVKQQNTSGNIHAFNVGIGVGNMIAGAHIDGVSTDLYETQEMYPVFGMISAYVDYNDPYTHDSNEPYKQFSLDVQGGMGKGSGTAGPCAYPDVDENLFYDIRILSDAMMFARTIDCGENKDTSLGMCMIYDFDWHSYYMLSSLAPGFAFKQRINGEDSKVEWQAQLAAILLGTTDLYYYHRDVNNVFSNQSGTFRSYSDTIGAQTILKFKHSAESGRCLDVNFRGYAMYDFYDQLQNTEIESAGWEFIGLLSAAYEIPVSKRVRLGVKDEVYGKMSFFNSHKQPETGNYKQIANTARVYAKLVLK